MNPLWMPQAIPTINPYAMMVPPQPTPVQNTIQVQPPQPQQPTSTWNWKVVKDYQSVLQESVPFDGTPVLFMLSDSSTFYVVNMVDGKKMVNGYEFSPLNNVEVNQNIQPELTPDERLNRLENSLLQLTNQIEKLMEVRGNESNTEVAEPETAEVIQRKPIK